MDTLNDHRPDESKRSTQLAIALTVAYQGAPFAGFARQPGLDTVQGRLEAALRIVLGREVQTTAAGRTDAGVHALGQVVSFPALGDEPDPDRLRRSLDALSGDEIVIKEVRRARAGFSARFDATARQYRYRVVTGSAPPVFLAKHAWHVPRALDVDAMRAGAAHLVGEHDFRSFCVTGSSQSKRTVRRVDVIEIVHEEHLGEQCVCVFVEGNAFLHSMVRIIVGTLVEVGIGRRASGWVPVALAARERVAAGPTAPACGLTLHRVSYPDDVWL